MRRGGTLVVAIALLSFAGCASVDTAPVRDLSGTWTGQCQNCPVQKFTLVVTQTGTQLSGTLQASPRTGLGTQPMTLRDGKVEGRDVRFSTQGADGVNLTVGLRVSGDGNRMEGRGTHRAAFPLSFSRE